MREYKGFDKNFDLKQIVVPSKIKRNDSYLLAKYANIGYYLLTPILFGLFGGLGADLVLKTGRVLFILGFSLGVVGTFYNLYKLYLDERARN